MKIDAHHHFWNYDPQQYGWIDDQMASLRRDFLPADLAGEIRKAGVGGVVSVQARQTMEETYWLLKLAECHDYIKGVVGWVPLVEPSVEQCLEQFRSSKKLKAIRHVLQDEEDDQFVGRDDFNNGIRHLKKFGLVYDILIFDHHLPQTIEFVDRHPEQVFVLDHIGKPRIRDCQREPWQADIFELSKRDNVACKLSGMVTEADWRSWDPDKLKWYFDIVLDAFSPRRLMFGSDWPVGLLACSYKTWIDVAASWLSSLTPDEQHSIWADTASKVYNLKNSD